MLWLDTYFEWINPAGCCGVSREDNGEQCFDPSYKNDTCDICLTSSSDRPNKTEFETYLYWFLHDNPGIDCPSGGHAAFGGAVIINESDPIHHKNSSVLSKSCDVAYYIMASCTGFSPPGVIEGMVWAGFVTTYTVGKLV